MQSAVSDWLSSSSPVVLGLVLAAMMAVAAFGGYMLRKGALELAADEYQNLVLSALLGLLALLLGFTFALAVDRFETRRVLVLQEANAIGTAYLRAQLLEEPHRGRLSELITAYTDNRLALASARGDVVEPLLTRNDELLQDIWSATVAAFDDIREFDFSAAFLESMNMVVDLDSSRKAARAARVPTPVFVVLFLYVVLTAGTLGYTITSLRGRIQAAVLLFLLMSCLLLVIDIDRPTMGSIREIQTPMEQLRGMLHGQPPGSFDRWRRSDGAAGLESR